MFTGEHPWREWAIVVLILALGITIVVVLVKFIIAWAHKEDESPAVKREDDRPKGGPGKKP